MDAAAARALLDYLLAHEPGELKFITAGLLNPDYTRPADLPATTMDEWDPAYTELHDVVAIKERAASPGLIVAMTDEGDYAIGTAPDVLLRLTEWKYYDPRRPTETGGRTVAALEAKADVLRAVGKL